MIAQIGTVSYGLAAAAFAVLAGLLVSSWKGKLQGAWLLGAALTTALWCGVSAYAVAYNSQVGGTAADMLEILHSGLWLMFLWKLLESHTGVEASTANHQRRFKRVFHVGVALFSMVVLSAAILHLNVFNLNPGTALTGLFAGRIGLAVMGLALVEQLYRNASESQRWAVKYFCLGLGGLFAFDFYLYADAMLFRAIDTAIWNARGFTSVLMVPLIAVSAARNPQLDLDVFVSRRVVFYTTALFGAGVYLLVMAGAGYYIRLFGGNWGGVLQSTFMFSAAVVLLAILFSGALRARLKVFLNKHFFSYKYDYREEWLRFTRTLSAIEPGVSLRERSLRAVAELVDSTAAALWVEENGSFRQIANWNYNTVNDIELNSSPFCRFLTERQWVIDLNEYTEQPDIYGNLRLPVWLQKLPRARLITPLILHDHLMGFVVLADARSPRDFNWEDSDLLKTAGRQVAVYLAQIQANEALVEARQFESFNRLSTYVVHDLKNIVAQLSLLLTNAEKHKHKPEFQEDMIATVDNAVQRMSRLLSQLRPGYQSAQQATAVELRQMLEHIVQEKNNQRPVPQLEGVSESVWVIADKERLTRVLGHLIQNAIEATPESGTVGVILEIKQGQAVVEVRDSGSGMDEHFIREKLFRPFETTKSAGMGIGAYECREYVRQLNGEIKVESEVGRGTIFTVILPQRQPITQETASIPMQGAAGG